MVRTTIRGSGGAYAAAEALSTSTGTSRFSETPQDERRAYLDVDDDRPVFCPECAEREFGAALSPD
jgi:hypothetical protein